MRPEYHVLVIDGHAEDVEMVRDVLIPAGFHVHERSDGASGVEAFFNLHPDLVLIDSRLSDVDGIQVSRLLKRTEQGRLTPMVMMTGAPPERRKRTRELAENGCSLNIQKPLSPKALLDAMLLFVPQAFRFPGLESSESGTRSSEPSAAKREEAGDSGPMSSPSTTSGGTPDDKWPTRR